MDAPLMRGGNFPDGNEGRIGRKIDGEGLTTNCCFGGDDLRTLFVTDAMPGNVVAFKHMPTAGLPLPTWVPL